jgi:hypothetical protein
LFPKTHFLKPKDQCSNPVPYLEACEVTEEGIEWSGRWLDYQPALLYSARSPELFRGSKLLVPSLLSSRRIRAVLDEGGFFADQSLVCISPTYKLPGPARGGQRPSLRNVLRQLNAMTVSFYFAHAIVGEALGGGAIHATPGLVSELPIVPHRALEEASTKDCNERIWEICGLSKSERLLVATWHATSGCGWRTPRKHCSAAQEVC